MTPPTGAPPNGGPRQRAPAASPGGDGSATDLTPTDDKRYLRGAQVTNSDGIVEFTTIWPGWYRGRTVHIHAMVHFSNARVLTTQMMFDEALNTKVFAKSPYAAHTGRDTFNDSDNIYKDSMLLKVTEEGDGYLGGDRLLGGLRPRRAVSGRARGRVNGSARWGPPRRRRGRPCAAR